MISNDEVARIAARGRRRRAAAQVDPAAGGVRAGHLRQHQGAAARHRRTTLAGLTAADARRSAGGPCARPPVNSAGSQGRWRSRSARRPSSGWACEKPSARAKPASCSTPDCSDKRCKSVETRRDYARVSGRETTRRSDRCAADHAGDVLRQGAGRRPPEPDPGRSVRQGDRRAHRLRLEKDRDHGGQLAVGDHPVGALRQLDPPVPGRTSEVRRAAPGLRAGQPVLSGGTRARGRVVRRRLSRRRRAASDSCFPRATTTT